MSFRDLRAPSYLRGFSFWVRRSVRFSPACFKLMKPSGHVNYYGLIFGGEDLGGPNGSCAAAVAPDAVGSDAYPQPERLRPRARQRRTDRGERHVRALARVNGRRVMRGRGIEDDEPGGRHQQGPGGARRPRTERRPCRRCVDEQQPTHWIGLIAILAY
jgi:hypothetical protein